VRISLPASGRYPEGAPIAVHQIAGLGSADGAPACFSEAGFIDVSGLCPGRASAAQPDGRVWKSGGTASFDTATCTETFADVLAFASGGLRSTEGKSFRDYTAGVTPLQTNLGVVGWSIGGNIEMDAMARFAERFQNVKWYASWESPFHPYGFSADTGSVMKANRFYDPGTGDIDFHTLRYAADTPVRYFPFAVVPAEARALKGSLMLDGGPFGPAANYPFIATFRPGAQPTLFYSALVTRAAKQRGVFDAGWPSHIAMPDEAARFEADRAHELVASIPKVVSLFPGLAVCVFESAEHHGVDDAGHPWAVAQINAFLDAHARWVRLNPDARYVAWAMGRKPSKIIQNSAGKRFTSISIRDAVEPEDREGGPTDKAGMTAAVAELADRTRRKHWTGLNGILIPGAPGGVTLKQ
jgi:hypothetical protein